MTRLNATLGFPEPVIRDRIGAPGPLLILCDHASSRIPARYNNLGLDSQALASHIAWDPGALAVAALMAKALDCELIGAGYSRLLIDVNRDPAAPDSIVTRSETTKVPGNVEIGPAERDRRVRGLYAPFHAAVDAALEARATRQPRVGVVSVHSFTPRYAGRARPWHVGILFDRDRRLAEPLLSALQAEADLAVGINEPYSPADRVYHTLTRHAEARDLPCTMIEIRNDLIADQYGQRSWATRLVQALGRAMPSALDS